MFLSDTTITEYLSNGKIIIHPEINLKDIRPVGIRLHLGEDILLPKIGETVDMGSGSPEDLFIAAKIGPEGFVLKPDDFILGTTHEIYKVATDLVCFIDGRSTLARLGLTVHNTSQIADGNWVDPGSTVLEIKNNGPFDIILRSGIPIAMLSFVKLSAPTQDINGIKYQGQVTVEPPKLEVESHN